MYQCLKTKARQPVSDKDVINVLNSTNAWSNLDDDTYEVKLEAIEDGAEVEASDDETVGVEKDFMYDSDNDKKYIPSPSEVNSDSEEEQQRLSTIN